MKHAFSLVELSIVLVILGLLTGGILGGQSLIRAAELRAVASEFQRYATATQTFRDKYFAIPGDFRDATKFWLRLNSNADCVTNSSASVATPGACDGDGDGSPLWQNGGSAGSSREMHQYWRHLALAGLIEGDYTGISAGTGNSASVTPGINSPRSKFSNAGWGAGGLNCGYSGQCYYGAGHAIYRTFLIVGRPIAANNVPGEPAFKPEEAWNIDTKMDDGLPATGKIIPRWTAANACTTSATNLDTAGTYNLIDSGVLCSLFFVNFY